MREVFSIGPAPSEEDPIQVGHKDYPKLAWKECVVFRAQIVRELGDPPMGAALKITTNPHDFGTYYEVAVIFDDRNEEAYDYAMKVEDECPRNWDRVSLDALGEFGGR